MQSEKVERDVPFHACEGVSHVAACLANVAHVVHRKVTDDDRPRVDDDVPHHFFLLDANLKGGEGNGRV